MRFILVISLILIPRVFSQTVERVNSDDTCENYRQLIQDYIDFELAGARWQGGDAYCLKDLKLKTMSDDKMILPADPTLHEPKYLLLEGREITADYKRVGDNLLEVKITYIGRSPASKEDAPVRDSFKLKLNFGHSRDIRGCASVFSPPENFVMKQKCWKD